MINIKYPLATSSWDNAEIQAINTVVKNGMFTMGECVKQFEHDFANYMGSNYCVMVNSGSSANLLMIAALFYTKENKLQIGDEVIVPAVSWPTTYYPLYQYGLKLKFVDIDKNTLNYDLQALKEAISNKTKLIMVVNLLGNPNEFDKINQMIEHKNIRLIEDNCESMGAIYNNKYTGTFGVMGTFSSFFSHHISTMEGGMIVTDNEELYHILLSLRAHGWTRNLPNNNHVSGVKNIDPFMELFNFVLPGYNFRPLEMSGAIGIEQIKKLPSIIKIRQENAKYIKHKFSNHSLVSIQQEIGQSSWFGFSLVLKDNILYKREQFTNLLLSNGIECRPIVAGNFVKNDVMKYFNYEIFGELKNADYIHNRGFFVGNNHIDITSQIDRLYNVLNTLI